VERGKLSAGKLKSVFNGYLLSHSSRMVGIPGAEVNDARILWKEVNLRVNPQKWDIVSIDKEKELAMVSSGNQAGYTPIGPNPDYSWECPACGSYGPWNGSRCLNCGRLSDPND
jgi:hypothetical protein